MLEVDRKQVMAYRIAAHGLHREREDPTELAVFDLGVQDVTQRDTAILALVARLAPETAATSLVDDPRFTLAWSHRGAPHYHRAAEFPGLVPALFPLNETDAETRMLWQRKEVASAGMPASEVLLTAARAMRKVVDKPMTKGAASTAVTKVVPAPLTRWCRGCQATHIHEQLMRLASPLAGLRLESGATPATLAPLRPRPRIPTKPDVAGTTRLVERYLRLHGPATSGDPAGFVGTTKKVIDEIWPTGLTEVRVGGRVTALPKERIPELENPPEPDATRLLPPWDPFLQARDRHLLVPEKEHQKEVWKIIGNPGTLLADGDIAGTWRTKSTSKRLDFTIATFWTLPAPVRKEVEAEAARIAAVRGFADHQVTWAA